MRVINNSDTRTFTDGAGDQLVLLVSVRHRDVVERERIETEENRENLKALGMTIEDAVKAAKEATEEEKAAAKSGKAEHSPKVRRYMLGAVAVKLTIAGQDTGGDAIMDAYDRMDPASASWVDDQVETVWTGAVPGDDERAKLEGSPSTV